MQTRTIQSTRLATFEGIKITKSVFENDFDFIRVVQEGLSGAVVRQAIDALGHRELFVDILAVQSSKLSRIYRRKRLNRSDSESVLDLITVLVEAAHVFEGHDIADEWLHTILPALGDSRPIDLCNTFKGRALVLAALRKLEHGDFS